MIFDEDRKAFIISREAEPLFTLKYVVTFFYCCCGVPRDSRVVLRLARTILPSGPRVEQMATTKPGGPRCRDTLFRKGHLIPRVNLWDFQQALSRFWTKDYCVCSVVIAFSEVFAPEKALQE